MRGAVVLALCLVACGARTDPISRGEASNGDGGAVGDSGPSRPCTVDGVRWCGAGCPRLSEAECPGGCMQVLDAETLSPLQVGLCWSDMRPSGHGSDPCAACEDGDTCAQRDRQRLVCVSEPVCAKLAALGAGAACRYADKTPYDGRPLLASAAVCPTSTPGAACGGGCGPCPTWFPYYTSHRCTGRSATRSFGVCPFLRSSGDETTLITCAWEGNTQIQGCPKRVNWNKGDDVASCLVFDIGGTPLTLASRYGLCVAESLCWETKQRVGGVFCLPP